MNQLLRKMLFCIQLFGIFSFTNGFACGSGPDSGGIIRIPVNGSLLCVWTGIIGNHGVIQSRLSLDGIHWEEIDTISDPNAFAGHPVMESDCQGNVTVIWATSIYGINNPCLMSAYLPVGGSWSKPAMILDGTELFVFNYDLEINSKGIVVASWTGLEPKGNNNPGFNILLRTSSSISPGQWTSPITLSQ
jgi:hypothetical protein